MMRFKKVSEPYIIVVAAIAGFMISSLRAQAQADSPLSGSWRGEFAIRDGIKAPFNFDIADDSTVYLINGPERFEAGKVQAKGDSLFIALDQFDNELALAKRNHSLTGVLRRQDQTAIIAPLTASFGEKSRFRSSSKPARDISGTYEVEFAFESGNKEKAVAILKQDGQKLTGTFLKPSGDTRFLEGIVDGERFFLSSFIGSSPGYYEGTVSPNGTIRGFQAGTRVKHTFTGKINPAAGIQDPYAVTRVRDGSNKIAFTLPDIKGNLVSLTDEKYRNKVVIVAITGTWCPNCIDEAAFLSPWYNNNRERGVEVITVHFERQADTAFTRKVMTRFRKRFNIEYDQVFGGISQKDSVTKAIAGLDAFRSFPTTIFIDKKGNVSKIHAGYTGPATGRFYDEFVKEFNDEVDRLLKQ